MTLESTKLEEKTPNATSTPEQVFEWARQIISENSAKKLLKQEVDGEVFLSLTEEDLTQKPGGFEFTFGEARKLLLRLSTRRSRDLNTIIDELRESGKLIFIHPSPLHNLYGFVSRGLEVEHLLARFFSNNLQMNYSKDKHDHFFLYCINGSGYGKTWFGFYVPLCLKELYPKLRILYLHLDFSNGSEWDKLIDEIDPTVSLGLRVAAQYIFHISLRDLKNTLNEKDISWAKYFTFSNVMAWISKQLYLSQQNSCAFVLHLDEMQGNPLLAQNILHVIGSYMCSTNLAQSSDSQKHHIILFPVITGTSSKHFKSEVTHYGNAKVYLSPFNYDDSLHVLQNHITRFQVSQWRNHPIFERLVKVCGGLPRYLQYLGQELDTYFKATSYPSFNQDSIKPILDNLKTKLETTYKISQWHSAFGGVNNLKRVVAMCVSNTSVLLDCEVSKNLTIEDILKEGVIYLKTCNGSYSIIVIPLIVLDMMNVYYYIWPISLLDPLINAWTWESFEKWECSFELVKNNSACVAELMEVPLSYFYTSCCKENIGSKKFNLKEFLTVVNEVHQFLPKTPSDNLDNLNFIETDQGPIPDSSFARYSFRCCYGNPSVDSRVFRKSTDQEKLLMICKQLKHSTSQKSSISLDKLHTLYNTFKTRVKPFFNKYICFYVLITNRTITITDIQQFFKVHNNVAIVHRHNFEEYCTTTFSSYSIFDE